MVQRFWKRLWGMVFGFSLAVGAVGFALCFWLWGAQAAIAIAVGIVAGLLNQFILGTSLRKVSERPETSKAVVLLGTFGRGALVGAGALAVALFLGTMETVAYLAALLGVQVITIIVTTTLQSADSKAQNDDGTSGGPDGGEQHGSR